MGKNRIFTRKTFLASSFPLNVILIQWGYHFENDKILSFKLNAVRSNAVLSRTALSARVSASVCMRWLNNSVFRPSFPVRRSEHEATQEFFPTG